MEINIMGYEYNSSCEYLKEGTKDCFYFFDCCDCGSGGNSDFTCCRYCFSCNACDSCLIEADYDLDE